MSKKFIIGLVTVTIAVVVAGAGVRWYARTHSKSSANACINNLRVIDAAKQQWALEHHAQATNTPSWDDLLSYLPHGKIPICGNGGTYTIGRMSQAPTCSHPGDVLP